MPQRILLSGPAGSGKSQIARALLNELSDPTVAADFQSVVVALLQLQRLADGKYPIRPEWVLPIAEYTRRAIITGAVNRDLGLIVTNSDGDPGRRAFLLDQMGPDAVERIEDPGQDVVSARLADPLTGELSIECEGAIERWYDGLGS